MVCVCLRQLASYAWGSPVWLCDVWGLFHCWSCVGWSMSGVHHYWCFRIAGGCFLFRMIWKFGVVVLIEFGLRVVVVAGRNSVATWCAWIARFPATRVACVQEWCVARPPRGGHSAECKISTPELEFFIVSSRELRWLIMVDMEIGSFVWLPFFGIGNDLCTNMANGWILERRSFDQLSSW